MIRVLVVDDHPVFRTALVGALSLIPSVDVAGQTDGGVAACAAASELEPDLVLMDVSLPDLSGIEAMRHIHVRLPHVPVVFLTARADAGVRREAIVAGAAGFVAKGTPLDEIVRILHNAVGIKRPGRSLSWT